MGIDSSTFVLAKTWKWHKHPPTYRWTNKCGPSTHGSITQPWKAVKPWHSLPHGWTLRTRCSVIDADTEGHSVWFHWQETSRTGRSTDPESGFLLSGAGEHRMGSDCWWRQDVFWQLQNVLGCEHFSEFYDTWIIHHHWTLNIYTSIIHHQLNTHCTYIQWTYFIPLCPLLYICCLVTKSCLSLCDTLDYRPPGVYVQGISQARILEWIAISFSRGSSQPRNQAGISCIDRWILYCWATREIYIYIYNASL